MSTGPAATGTPMPDAATVARRTMTILQAQARDAVDFSGHLAATGGRAQDIADYRAIADLLGLIAVEIDAGHYRTFINDMIQADATGAAPVSDIPCDHSDDRTCVACDPADYCPVHEVKLDNDGGCGECDRLDTKQAKR